MYEMCGAAGFAEFFACCRRLLGPLDASALALCEERVALIPPEIASWIKVANTPEYPVGETEKLRALLLSAERLGYCILSTRKLAEIDTPTEIRDRMRGHLARVEAGCREILTELEATFERGKRAEAQPSQLVAFQPLETELAEIRLRYLSGAIQFPAALAYLGAMNFVEDASRTLDRCVEQIRGLALERYRGDYAL